jgi:small ligand-binding sensory domain FIST
MPFAAALSQARSATQAVDEVVAQLQEQQPAKPDLVLAFFSPHHKRAAAEIAGSLETRLAPKALLGCMGESIVGNDVEIEGEPALAVWTAAWSKPVEMSAFCLAPEQTPDGLSILGWPDSLTDADPKHATLLLFGDPYTLPIDTLLLNLNENHPGLPVVGGMTSGARGAGESRLLFGNSVQALGAVGVLLQGPLGVRSIVSQGCRPIGKPMVVTKTRENIIEALGGQTPLAQLQELWPTLSTSDQALFQNGLHIGRVMNEYQGEFSRGDFLVRNVMGLEQESGALAITDHLRVGQTVQFHVRDAQSASEDLHTLLKRDRKNETQAPAGGLVFTCNGRGCRLFGEPNHDALAIRGETGNVPLAGFFAQGEIGPVGGQNFIHGFTASVLLFED